MTREELLKRMKGVEWCDVEFKLAQREVPKTAYESVSAFANTGGGCLVFGVEEAGGKFTVVGVVEVEKVQSDFLNTLRSGHKLSCVITPKASLVECDTKHVLVFYIPEARRQDKPVHFAKEMDRAYIRRGSCDHRCTAEELRRLIRDAAKTPYDGDLLDIDPQRCFDAESIKWYRAIFNSRSQTANPAHSDLDFLYDCGLVVDQGGVPRPTRASILLFGNNGAFLQCLPRAVVDFQWNSATKEDVTADVRWGDRLIADFNLCRTWSSLAERYAAHAAKPFKIDPATMQRQDMPVDYVAFREAAINLLIHQDYSDHGRKAEIRLYSDRVEFHNPGDAFASTEELLEPGAKELRNPRIVSAFRRIGLSEEAGTGVRSIFNTWQRLGNMPPVIHNDKAEKTFGLVLLKEPLLSEEQLLFQAQVGARLTEPQAKVLAYSCRAGPVRLSDAKMVTGLPAREAQGVLDALATQVLLEADGIGEVRTYEVAKHLRGKLAATREPASADPSLVSDQPRPTPRLVTGTTPASAQPAQNRPEIGSGEPLQSLSDMQFRIVGICEAPRTVAAMMASLGVSNRTHFRRTHLDPLVRGGVLSLTHPETPNHPSQAYVLSPAGLKLKAMRDSSKTAPPESKA